MRFPRKVFNIIRDDPEQNQPLSGFGAVSTPAAVETFRGSGIHSPYPELDDDRSDDDALDDSQDSDIPSTPDTPNFGRADREFGKRFIDNEFGYACDVCARIWFRNDLKSITNAEANVLAATNWFETVEGFSACITCRHSLKRGLIPTLSQTNGFTYPNFPSNLPPLDPLTTRLVSPRINFMQLGRLRHAAGL